MNLILNPTANHLMQNSPELAVRTVVLLLPITVQTNIVEA